MGRLGEGRDLERDAFALGGLADASNCGVVRLIRHRRSLAPGLRPAGAPADGAVASSAMKVIVLADGDAPERAGLDAAWPGWADGVDVVAADGGARHARTARARTRRMGRRRRFHRAAGARDARRERRDGRSRAVQGRIGHRARGARGRRPRCRRRSSILGALGGRRSTTRSPTSASWRIAAAGGLRVALLDERSRVRLDLPGPRSESAAGRPRRRSRLAPALRHGASA